MREVDTVVLENSHGFQHLRQSLIVPGMSSFCGNHSILEVKEQENWLLHRDIMHALLAPVLQLYREASRVAESFLGTYLEYDLELAFRGEARGAFTWLQCLIMEEGDWCSTRGCPACVVSHTLQSEPTIRLSLMACRLSRTLRKQTASPDLPLFDFWRSSLRNALDRDPFWGSKHAKEIEERAAALEICVKDLMRQNHELEKTVRSSPQKSQNVSVTVTSVSLALLGY
ncbi:hypothetical protein MMC09_000419 [Bachmanniomyces sp. S44760]|nr:hypothetical protein [Bachmanniomyces sp. S44760]